MFLNNSQQRQAGLTLVELMIAIAIIGILSAIAIPNYLSWLPNYRLKSAARDLQGHFQTAKLEAIKRGANVSIQVNTGAYVPAGRVGSYVVFVDSNTNNAYDNPGDTLITQVAMPANVSLTVSSYANPVVYSSRGLPNLGGNITMRNSRDESGRLLINLAGRVRIERSISTDGGATWPAYQLWD